MDAKKYLGDLIGGALWIRESRIIATTLLESPTEDEWKQLIVSENILQKKSSLTAIRYAKTIRCRIEVFGEAFLTQLVNANEREYIQMLMITLLINSPIVADFMLYTLAEARRTYMPSLTTGAWNEFYDTRVRAYPELGDFSESSIKKMGTNTVKALVESGYLSDSRTKKIQPVYLVPEVKDWLVRLGREDLIDVMECTI